MSLTVSRPRKVEFLLNLTTAELLDSVVRPLMSRLRYAERGAGPNESRAFERAGTFGETETTMVWCVASNLNLGEAGEAEVLRLLALLTEAATNEANPREFLVFVGGRASAQASARLKESTPVLTKVVDRELLIPEIDEHYPDFWSSVDPRKYPYLRALLESLVDPEADGGHPFDCPVSGEAFLPLSVLRVSADRKRFQGRTQVTPKFEEFEVVGLARRSAPRVLLLGDAGAGKTTSMRRLAHVLAEGFMSGQPHGRVPVLLRAKDIVNSDDLENEISHRADSIAQTAATVLDENDFADGKVAVFVDGLDELRSQEDRIRLTNRLALWALKTRPKCRVFVSSRDYQWVHELPGLQPFDTYRLSAISWKESDKIIQRIQSGQSLDSSDSQEVLRRLEEVHGLELSPLLVAVFASSSDLHRTDIPANITEIFKKFTEEMLGRWDSSKGFAQQYQAPLKDFLLRRVAGRLHRNGVTSVDSETLQGWLVEDLRVRGHELEDAGQLAAEITDRSGLLVEIGGNVEFRHHILQEFFAGRDLAPEEIPPLLVHSWWQRPLVFYFGDNPDRIGLLQDLSRGLPELEGNELAQASMTLGLTLQASYLSVLDERVDVYVRVLHGLAAATRAVFGADDDTVSLSPFITAYLLGRDAVASRLLRTRLDQVNEALAEFEDVDYLDYLDFWFLTGLIEEGEFKEAGARTPRFKPKDERTLLGLFVGANWYANLGHRPAAKTKEAAKYAAKLEPRTLHLRERLLDEVKSILLEIRHGELAPLPDDRYQPALQEPAGED